MGTIRLGRARLGDAVLMTKTGSANTADLQSPRNANAVIHSARAELLRADAACHRAANCVEKHEQRLALRAAADHANRALTLLRGVNI